MGKLRLGPVVIAIAAQLGGCSLTLMQKTPDNVPPGVWVECTESRTFPSIDGGLGVLMLIGAIGISTAGDDSNSDFSEEGAAVAAGFYGVAGVALLYSAYVGFRESSQCEQVHEDARARGVYGPYPYGPYPQPYPYPQPQPYPQPYPQPQPQPPPAPQ